MVITSLMAEYIDRYHSNNRLSLSLELEHRNVKLHFQSVSVKCKNERLTFTVYLKT
jgi:hypothetical protein